MTICGRAWWANIAEMLVPLQNLVLRCKFATNAGRPTLIMHMTIAEKDKIRKDEIDRILQHNDPKKEWDGILNTGTGPTADYRQAYKRLLLRVHPDKVQGDLWTKKATKAFKRTTFPATVYYV